jgi:hypothetical protein
VVVDLLDRKLLFVTGKGGVGKTSVAAALGLLAASHGKRSLVCEVDAKGDLAFAFEADRLRFKPREVQPGLWAMAMDTEQSLREYLNLQLHLPLVGRIGPLAEPRLRRQRGAGCEGDPHRRQADLRVRRELRHRDATLRRPVTSWRSSARRRDRGLVQVGSCAIRPDGCSTS